MKKLSKREKELGSEKRGRVASCFGKGFMHEPGVGINHRDDDDRFPPLFSSPPPPIAVI